MCFNITTQNLVDCDNIFWVITGGTTKNFDVFDLWPLLTGLTLIFNLRGAANSDF